MCRATLKMLAVAGSAVLASAIAAAPFSPAAEPTGELQRFQRAEPHMGTRFGVVFYADDEGTANRAFTAAFARIAELNRVCSDYDPQSELSRLSVRSPTTEPVTVSRDLHRVLAASQELSERSGGAFDVTVGPLARIWRRARLQKRPPSAEKIREALESVGYQALVVDRTAPLVELRRPHMRLDLGAIAKGFAVDEALQVLREHGITRALVNAGGNLAVGEPPPGEKGWRIEIASLDPGSRPVESLRLARVGVATSGDAYQFLQADGKRYSHILDPRTGWGLTERRSVTVVAPSGMLADGLSTAVSVLGRGAGFDLIENTPQTASCLTELRQGEPVTFQTSRFLQYTASP